uniref:Uncharacterized protein n=1 Tax=Arundo donax TaxID=35708 RepID=A0A0A9BE23_ARUDO
MFIWRLSLFRCSLCYYPKMHDLLLCILF